MGCGACPSGGRHANRTAPIGQVFQARAAVYQQHLRSDGAHSLIGTHRAIAPPLQLGKKALLSKLHSLAAEHTASKCEAIEAAKAVKSVKTAEKIAISGNVGPYGLIHPARPGPTKGGLVLPDQADPRLRGSPPIGNALLRAAAEHQCDRVLARPAMEWGIRAAA